MFRWYAVNTYSGHENKVKQNLEHRRISLGQENNIRQIVIPTEQVQEMKDGQKQTKEQRTMPGYLLVNMNLTDDSWQLVKNTPGVTGFVGAAQNPVPLNQAEVDRLLHRETAERPRTRAQFSIGESVKVVSGPLSDFSGEISEINEDAAKLKVLVSIFANGERVDIVGAGRGKGFQGVVRRHHFAGGAATHGSMFHRAPGSIGASSFPSRVIKGMRAAGRMGGGRVTIHNLKVLRGDPENHLLIVEGGIPGAPSSYVIVRKAVTAKKIKVAQVEKVKKGKK